MTEPKKRVILVILDGWGIAPKGRGNAIEKARTPNMDRLWSSYPNGQLSASGESVGLPKGEPGNTETGHLNLGAGKIVYQDVARINMAIADGSFFKNETLVDSINHAIKNKSNLHYMGLVGAGGVHSNIEHLFALINLAKRKNFKNVYFHLFTDGRDSPPTAALNYINQIREVSKREGVGTIASIIGRYWAMDRDQRWERTAKAYFALTQGKGQLIKTPEEIIEQSYAQGKTDEFIEPSLISSPEGVPVALIKDGDSIVFFNFRIDRPRQLTKAFISKEFRKTVKEQDHDPYITKFDKNDSKEKRGSGTFNRELLKDLYFVTMTEYSKKIVEDGARDAFPPEDVKYTLGRVIETNNLRQLRVTESEKERFVTYYFNGQREKPYKSEDRIIIPSPKVPTYDKKPEMSSDKLTKKLLGTLENTPDYSFVLVNYPNVDMVGHTGCIEPAVKACEVVDECIGKISEYVLAYGGFLIITADHGNAEEMINSHTGQVDTEHSSNNVPFIAVSNELTGKSRSVSSGILADIVPTVLAMLGINKPSEMTGKNLLKGIWK